MQTTAPYEQFHVFERLFIFAILAVIGIGISLLLEFPAAALIAPVVGAVTCIGADSVLRAHPRMQLRPFLDSLPGWLLPATLTVSACLFLRLLGRGYWQIGGLMLTGVLLAGIYYAEYRLLDPDDEYTQTAQQGILLATYLTAFAAMAAIYSTKARSLQSATALFAVATLLTYELLRNTGVRETGVRRRWLYAVCAGLCVAETIWALNYLAISGLAGGAILLLTYYVISGLAHTHLSGLLSRSRAIEYLGVSLLGLAMILSSRFVLG